MQNEVQKIDNLSKEDLVDMVNRLRATITLLLPHLPEEIIEPEENNFFSVKSEEFVLAKEMLSKTLIKE